MEVTIATVLTNVGDVLTAAIGWAGDVFTMLAEQPIAFIICVGVPLAMAGFAVVRRLISL